MDGLCDNAGMPTSALLASVGYGWARHPHRMHTMRVSPDLDAGIEVVGGPWTTGQRARDTIEPAAEWAEVPGIATRPFVLERRRAVGRGAAECRWALPDDEHGPVALVGFSIRSLSHDAGFNLAGLSVGTDGAGSAWVRVEAGKVPDRPEHFAEIEIEADLQLAGVGPDAGHPTPVVPEVRRVEAAGVHNGAGVNPQHRARLLRVGPEAPLALGGFSWSVTNTPKRRGRYLRRWVTRVVPGGVEFLVSNAGIVTRPTDLDLEAFAVVARSPDA